MEINWRFQVQVLWQNWYYDTKKRFSKKIETTIHSGGKITLENTNWTFCLVNVLYIKTKEWHEVLIGDQTSPPACVLLIYDIYFFQFSIIIDASRPSRDMGFLKLHYAEIQFKNMAFWKVSITILSLYKAYWQGKTSN